MNDHQMKPKQGTTGPLMLNSKWGMQLQSKPDWIFYSDPNGNPLRNRVEWMKAANLACKLGYVHPASGDNIRPLWYLTKLGQAWMKLLS